MYYFPVGKIQTEMGFSQPLVGIFLIPVTASFWCIIFWARKSPKLNRLNIFKFMILALVPFFIAFIKSEPLTSILVYDINDHSKRPSFIILLLIAFAVLITQAKIVYSMLSIALLIIFYNLSVGMSFVSYYTLFYS